MYISLLLYTSKSYIGKDNSLEFPDIFIGATGVYYNLPVYTHNLKHFKLIKGITLYKEQ